MEKAQPYVGITGFTDVEEVHMALDLFEAQNFRPGAARQGMIGFALDQKRINSPEGETRHRYVKDPADILPLADAVDGRALAMVHYNPPKEGLSLEGVQDVFHHLYRDKLCRAIQLNTPSPDPAVVQSIKHKYPDMQIVFSVHAELRKRALAAVFTALEECRDALSYVLFDFSQGRGEDMPILTAESTIQVLQEVFPELTFGTAGGYSGENAEERIRRLRPTLGDRISVDAEGRLRDEHDRLVMEKVAQYLRAVRAGFTG